jgi:NADH-quinone oxidoreductase subunit J
MFTLQEWSGLRNTGGGRLAAAQVAPVEGAPRGFLPPPESIDAHPFSRPPAGELGRVRGLGRSLFGDYLFAVELAGTLLLIATIGAIAIAPRRSQGTL